VCGCDVGDHGVAGGIEGGRTDESRQNRDRQVSPEIPDESEAEEDDRAPQECREHNRLAAVTVGEGAGDQAGGHARGGQSGQADAHEGERDTDEVVEVDRGERVVEPLPEPEDQHRYQQEPHPSVELAQHRARLLQHPTIISGNIPQISTMSSY
jgi:hypothetical protein